MKLIKDWKLVLKHARSVHFTVLALVCWIFMALDSACSAACGFLPIPPFALALVSFCLTLAALAARFIYQEKCHAGS